MNCRYKDNSLLKYERISNYTLSISVPDLALASF